MSERDDFDKWVDCDLIDNGHPLEIAWLAWQAARRTVSGQEAQRDVRDFQRELANYFEDVGDPHGAAMIRNFADLSGYAAPIPATEQEKP